MQSSVSESDSVLECSWEETIKQTLNNTVVKVTSKDNLKGDKVCTDTAVNVQSSNIPVTVYHIVEVPRLLKDTDCAASRDIVPITNSSTRNKDDSMSNKSTEVRGIGILQKITKRCYSEFFKEEITASILEELPGLSLVSMDCSLANQQRCLICKKSFKHGSHLKRHLNSHTKEKSYKCVDCGKCYMDTSTLARHKKIHSGDKPWSCKICCKPFGTLGSLRRHVTIHNQEGRPHICSVCDKRFPDNSSLQKHIFIHSGIKPYICNICNKSFVHLGDLNGHKKLHDGFKPFKCDQCGSEFAKHSNYIRHLSIHGEKTFTCNICCVGYKFQNSLTKHLLSHTKGKKLSIEGKGMVRERSKQNCGKIT